MIKLIGLTAGVFSVLATITTLLNEIMGGSGGEPIYEILFCVALLICPLVIIILYFWKKEKIKEKLNLSNVDFYVTIIVTWTVLFVFSLFLFFILLYADVLQGHGFFAGLEYVVLYPYLFEFFLIVTLILDVIWSGIKYIYIKLRRNNK